MRLLPIVDRELREASRRRGTYWLRTFVAAVIITISTCLFLFNMDQSPRLVAQLIFHTLGGGALLYCLIAGMHGTADSLSEEKREGTFGLLFLTDLKGYDVVLGKLVASSLNGFYGLLAILPVIGVPLLMGGLTGTQVANASLSLVNAMFLSMCLGMFASAVCRSHQRAVALTLTLLLTLTLGFPLLGTWLAWRSGWNELQLWCGLPSPVMSYIAGQASAGTFAKFSPEYFYASLGLVNGIALFFLGLACFIAPRSWQDRPAGVARLKWRERFKQWTLGDRDGRRGFRTRLLDQNAFFWLAARDRLKPAYVWAALGFLACIWIWGALKFRTDWIDEGIFIPTAFLLNSVLKNWFANEAVRQLSDDRKMGSLELLLSTPLGVEEIMRGQALALRRQFFWPVLLVLAVEITMLLSTSHSYSYYGHERTFRFCLWIGGMVMLIADLFALYWLGMWMGLSAKNPKRAFSGTVGRLLALPWVVWIVILTIFGLLSINSHVEFGAGTILGCWLALGFAADLGFGLWARESLLTRFREVATQRYLVKPSLWKRLFGSASGSAPHAE